MFNEAWWKNVEQDDIPVKTDKILKAILYPTTTGDKLPADKVLTTVNDIVKQQSAMRDNLIKTRTSMERLASEYAPKLNKAGNDEDELGDIVDELMDDASDIPDISEGVYDRNNNINCTWMITGDSVRVDGSHPRVKSILPLSKAQCIEVGKLIKTIRANTLEEFYQSSIDVMKTESGPWRKVTEKIDHIWSTEELANIIGVPALANAIPYNYDKVFIDHIIPGLIAYINASIRDVK